MSWLLGARARLRLLFPGAAESRMDEEIALHMEMEAERLVREEHLSPDEARRRALIAFGGVTQHKEELRRGRGTAWLGGVSLDTKLACRILLKYPGLTIVGVLAMSFGIWFGAVAFELVRLFVFPSLPLPGGDRIVQVRAWDSVKVSAERRVLADYVVWRDSVTTLTDLGAYRDGMQNLVVGDSGEPLPVAVAQITSSAFRIDPSAPLHGRVLTAADERTGAPPVAVIGHELWKTRFAGDPGVLGKRVRIGKAAATVVGVMPEGFEFPIAHELWTPLKVDSLRAAPGHAVGISVFGRRAPGASIEDVQAELASRPLHAAREPDAAPHLRPRVDLHAKQWDTPGSSNFMMFSVNGFALLLVVILCSNVAMLLFARAATRENELIVRSALGATRNRIVAQLFVEALVLGSVAAAVGLIAAHFALQTWGRGFIERNMGTLPFWFDPHLSRTTILYAMGVTVFAAAIAGMLPALKITRDLGMGLKQATVGALRFGGIWTAVIIVQVALTVAFPFVAYVGQREMIRIESFDIGFAAGEYLGMRLDMDEGEEGDPARDAKRAAFGAAVVRLRERVAAEPGVRGVTFVSRLPRTGHPERMVVPDSAGGVRRWEVGLAEIDSAYFGVLGAPVIAGRAFRANDVASPNPVAIVDQGFVDQVMPGQNVLGRKFSLIPYPGESKATYEIVGVVKELGMGLATHKHREAGVYLPAALDSGGPVFMVLHAKGDPLLLAPTVRALAAEVEPMLRVGAPIRLNETADEILWVVRLWLRVTMILTAIVLLLSLAGIYAVLSFTVARRTREIGIRVALGARPHHVVAAIFRRPLTQVGIGVVAGGLLVAGVATAITGGLSLQQAALLLGYVTLMFGVCLLACVVPTWRALKVDPAISLKAE